ncbi:hypothetical protein Cob_v004707 [Colletotrichum orbiculare MAFF 240422]|uniref:Uncharacterized protein n=1 Tax=Colletotrichum orbiculare (strain 104-T / ATCC 96160 / CBS 514.97 / LARS 414 / MAFF 240422) TaxID=1213857 RepID=A0A484FYG0_COLOR|nr:hypothetical protein Cob_v004707 [Colletotrichum orbiculare MAFF 240422]
MLSRKFRYWHLHRKHIWQTIRKTDVLVIHERLVLRIGNDHHDLEEPRPDLGRLSPGLHLHRHGAGRIVDVNFSLQATGSVLASVYGAVFVKQLGFINPFTVSTSISRASTSSRSAIVAVMIVMTTGFRLGWAPTSQILTAEIPSMRLCDMTHRTASVVNIAVQFTVAFAMPYLAQRATPKPKE